MNNNHNKLPLCGEHFLFCVPAVHYNRPPGAHGLHFLHLLVKVNKTLAASPAMELEMIHQKALVALQWCGVGKVSIVTSLTNWGIWRDTNLCLWQKTLGFLVKAQNNMEDNNAAHTRIKSSWIPLLTPWYLTLNTLCVSSSKISSSIFVTCTCPYRAQPSFWSGQYWTDSS